MDRRYAMKTIWVGLLLAGLLVTPAQAETVTYLHTDLLGSVVLETDQNRNVVARYEYEPYGLPRQAIADAPGYTGHVHDAGSGLVYMQQRYYDPAVGRFLSVDPVTASAINGTNFNRYWYGNNNPYKFTDPDGRYVESALDVAFIVADVADISSNGLNWTNGVSLAANVVGLALPGATGLGPATRAVSAGVDAAKGADKVGDGARFTVTPNGTVLDTSKDVNLVSTSKPTSDGGDFIQIHSSHRDAKAGDVRTHTHTSEAHTNPATGVTRTTRSDARPTTSGDIDRADAAVKSGEMRQRLNRDDKGG